MNRRKRFPLYGALILLPLMLTGTLAFVRAELRRPETVAPPPVPAYEPLTQQGEPVEQAAVLQGDNVGLGGPGVWLVQSDNIYGQPQSNGAIEAFSPESGVSQSVSIWFTGR